MRDDLHRTPALLRVWQGPVRHAARPADDDRVAYSMSRAANLQMQAGLRPDFVRHLGVALGGQDGQLFPESRSETLRAVERLASSSVEQRLVEAARAICMFSPETANVVKVAKSKVFDALVETGIEHSAAVVRTKFGASQSTSLKRNMAKHRAECSIELGSKRRSSKMGVDALLDFKIPAA